MTVIVERVIVTTVRLEAPTMKDADAAFDDLRARIKFSLPKRTFKPCRIIARDVTLAAGIVKPGQSML